RQQTLAGAIEWSWDQLTEWEKSAFVQSSVFVGGFNDEAAARVIDLSAHAGAPSPVAAVRALVSRSLATVAETPRGPRTSMYRPIREYAERRRAESGAEGAAAEDRHAAWCLELGNRSELQRRSPGEPEARDRMLAEMDNFLTAFDRLEGAQGADAPERARRACQVILPFEWIVERFCRNPGILARAERGLRRLETLPPSPGDSQLRAGLHTLAGNSYWQASDRVRAIPHFDLAVAAARESGDARFTARAVSGRILAHWSTGQYEEGLRLLEEVELFYAQQNDTGALGMTANMRGALLLWRGEVRPALTAFERGKTLCQQAGWGYGVAMVVGNMGIAWKELGDVDASTACYREALKFAETAGYPSLESSCLVNLAGELSDFGKFEEALQHFDRASEIDRRMGDKGLIARREGNRAVVFLRQGRYEEALRIMQACDRHLRETMDHAAVTANLTNMAAVLISMKRQDEALAPLAEAREKEAGTGNVLAIAQIDQYVGRAHFESGRYEEAAKVLRGAVQAGREVGVMRNFRHLLSACLLALSEDKLGRRAEALALVREIRPRVEADSFRMRDWDDSFHTYWLQTLALLEGGA
ncbi:MAG: adenylate/guanylate cyclase domain-containing, partial [Planctomycetota bacterium]